MLQLKIEHGGIKVDAKLATLSDYTERLRSIRESGAYGEYESSINLARDSLLLEQVKTLVADKSTAKLKYNIVVGIGGSNLGTKAVYDALFGFRDVMEPERVPKLLFAETTDPDWLKYAAQLLETIVEPEEVIVTIISKSGGTTETLANFEIIMQGLNAKFGSMTDRIVAITDEGSKLWEAAKAKSISTLAIPKPVGGRYSVLSAVGLFPLATVGIDIDNLVEGAKSLLDQCFADDNIAAKSAVVLAAQYDNGCVINDNFFFHPELESLGKWYRQLMGESVGKEQSLSGETLHIGITPTVSLGSTDLHSVGQLYLGGPKDKITTFVSTLQSAEVRVPEERVFPELVEMINGKTAAGITAAILEGVKAAYQKASLPYMEVKLDVIDERSLGAFLQFKMLEMMYLGILFNVNSFDQPNVEDYKIETKKLLESAASDL